MKKNKIKICVSIGFIVCLIGLSTFYRITLTRADMIGSDLPKYAETRRVVSVWLKSSYFTEGFSDYLLNYNIKNKDNLYIDFNLDGVDYPNTLKISQITSDKPDIYQLGSYEVLRTNKVKTLKTAGVDYSSVPNNNLLVYKGNPVGVKLAANTLKFTWNKEIFKASGLDPDNPPKTWEEVIKAARKIKKAFPDITPFEFPAIGYYDLKMSVGETSVNSGQSVYTSFWNYKDGKYDFTAAKKILSVYKEMYNEGLISKDFDTMDKKTVREDFWGKKSAMILSPYEDKVYFLTSLPLSFNFGVTDVPVFDKTAQKKYYYLDETSCLVINDPNGGTGARVQTKLEVNPVNKPTKADIKKVYELILNYWKTNPKDVNILKYKSDIFPEYSGYDDISKFSYEQKDPSPALAYGQKPINQGYWDAIKGNVSIDDTIKTLNDYMNSFCQDVLSRGIVSKNFFDSYKER